MKQIKYYLNTICLLETNLYSLSLMSKGEVKGKDVPYQKQMSALANNPISAQLMTCLGDRFESNLYDMWE